MPTSRQLPRPLALRWGVFWTVLGNGVYLGSQYGMLMAVAKLGNPTMVGEFSLALAIVTPVLVFSQMQLRQVYVTDAARTVPFAAFFWTRALTGTLAVAATVGIVALLRYPGPFQLVTVMLGLAKLGESQSDITYASLQRRERMDLVAVSMVVRGLLGLGAVTVGLWLTGTLLGAAVALAAAWAIGFLVLDVALLHTGPRADRLTAHWERSAIPGLVRLSAALALASGLVSLSASVPRYVLELFHGKHAVALFAVAMTPISLMGLFTGAVMQATLARASLYLHTGRRTAFRALAGKLAGLNVLFGAALVTLLLLWGRPVVRLLFTPEYQSAVPVMIILGAGVAFGGLAAFGSTVVTAGRQFNLQLANVILALVVQLPMCLLLVPRHGITGAAWAEFVKYVATTLFLHVAGVSVLRASAGALPGTSPCSTG